MRRAAANSNALKFIESNQFGKNNKKKIFICLNLNKKR